MNNKLYIAKLENKIKTLQEEIELNKSKKCDMTLEESEEIYKSFFEHSLLGQLYIGIDGSFLKINKSFCNMLQYTKEELMKLKIQDVTYGEDLEYTEYIFQRAANKELTNFCFEKRYVAKNGQILYCRLSSSLIYDNNNNPKYFVTQIEDITVRKISEENLRKFQKAIESSSASIIITDKSGHIEYVNPKFSEITGYSFQEVLGKNPRFLKSNHNPPSEYKELWETILSGNPWQGEFLNVKKNRDFYWEKAKISPIFNSKNKITHFVAVKDDITKQKEIETFLYESNKRYENLSQNIPGVLFQFMISAEGKLSIPYANMATNKILNISPKDLKNNPDFFISNIHKDDLLNFKNTFKISKETLTPFHWTGRIVIDNNIKWLQIDSSPSKTNDNGLLWDGVIIDVTKEKINEEKIKMLNEELKKLSYTDALTGVFNRRRIIEIGEEELNKAKDSNRKLSIGILDIDFFKKVNDTYGHINGDVVLKTISAKCSELLESEGYFGRFGGEEFLFILPNKNAQEAYEMAQKMCNLISNKTIKAGEYDISVTVSIGVSEANCGSDLNVAIKNADTALYKAKNNGRNRAETFL